MYARSIRFALLFLVAVSAPALAQKEKSQRLRVEGERSYSTWNRFVTPSGHDVNVRVTATKKQGYKAELVVGQPGARTGDARARPISAGLVGKGGVKGGQAVLTTPRPQKWLVTRMIDRMFGDPVAPVYPRFRLRLDGAEALEGGTAIGFQKLRVEQKSGFFSGWNPVVQAPARDLAAKTTEFDRSPINGAEGREIIDLLVKNGAKNVGAKGHTYRGLRVPRAELMHYRDEVRFHLLRNPAELRDALNGLREMGLRANHPIFERLAAE